MKVDVIRNRRMTSALAPGRRFVYCPGAPEGNGRRWKPACRWVATACVLGALGPLAWAGPGWGGADHPFQIVQTTRSSNPPPSETDDGPHPAVASTAIAPIPDVELVDQDGRKVRFYTDLVKDRVVAINFIYTSCPSVCPTLTANFAEFQRLMGDRVGKDLDMISISIDPVTDTPPRLKAWGEKFGAKPGWTFLTGKRRDVVRLLTALKVYTPMKDHHSRVVLIGDEAKGQWTRVYGLAPPSDLVRVAEGIIGDCVKGPAADETETYAGAWEGAADPKANEADASTREAEAGRDDFSCVPLVAQQGRIHAG